MLVRWHWLSDHAVGKICGTCRRTAESGVAQTVPVESGEALCCFGGVGVGHKKAALAGWFWPAN